jgi:hypothetical protein
MADGDPGERRRRAGGHPATVTPLCRSPRAAVPDWPSDHLRSKSPSRARARDAQTSTARSRARAHPPPSLESTSLGPGCAGTGMEFCVRARARDRRSYFTPAAQPGHRDPAVACDVAVRETRAHPAHARAMWSSDVIASRARARDATRTPTPSTRGRVGTWSREEAPEAERGLRARRSVAQNSDRPNIASIRGERRLHWLDQASTPSPPSSTTCLVLRDLCGLAPTEPRARFAGQPARS